MNSRMMNGRQPKARPKPLAVHEQIRDMYGFMVKPQHSEQFKKYATIYQEEETERSERWEQFLKSVNKNVSSAPAQELGSSEAKDVRADSLGSEDSSETTLRSETSNNRDEVADQGSKLWGPLRQSLRTIEQTTSISGRGLHPSAVSGRERTASNGTGHEGVARRIDLSSSSLEGEAEGNGNTDQIANDGAVAVATDSEAHLSRVGGEGIGEDSEDEFCDATESADVLRESISPPKPPKPAVIECPWEEELRSLVRGGVPMALRGELWQVFVGTKTRRIQGHYNALLTLLADGGGESNGVGGLLDCNGSAGANYLVSKTGIIEKWTNQIEKDLPRTFPGHPALDEDGRNALRRLLTAYARHNPSVGYCQAMNFLAGLLFLLMPEENAFWTLTGIIDDYFEGYYSEKMVEAQVDQLVFEDLVQDHFPKLVSHLRLLGAQVAWISGPWFLSIFVNVLPWESVLRVWDVLLYEGNRCMLFRTGLALLEIHAPALAATRDAGDAIATLQSMAGNTFDSSQLVLMACMGFQMVTESRLQELRLKHRPDVLAALEERSIELHLWRNSNSAMTQKLPYLYNVENPSGDSLLIKKSIVVSEEKPEQVTNGLRNGHTDDSTLDHQAGLNIRSPLSFEEVSVEKAITDSISPNHVEDRDGDAKEQVSWLKKELCQALEDKKAAFVRAEELESALVEMVKQDNRRLLSAKVEKLEAEVVSLKKQLTEKNEQEQALVQVLVRMEQEQKIADDARRFAEQDSAAQRRAAEVFQEKYEGAADAVAEMEKRAVMAESMLEATLSYQALGSSPRGSGPLRRSLTDSPRGSFRTPEATGASPSSRGTPPTAQSDQNGHKELNLQDTDENASNQRSFGLSWRDRSKARSGSTVASTQTHMRTSSEGSPGGGLPF
ncbi:unnamed protein product [Calypogeia fissa]